MAPRMLSLAALGLAVTPALSAASNCSIQTFQSFFDANGTNARVVYAHHYAENSTFVNPNITSAVNPTELPAACAIQVNATTDVNTHFSFGVFFPDTWNQRFFHAAQEGEDINWVDMAVGLRYGFAAVATDTGHTGSDMAGVWWKNPESISDWAWRANHLTSVLGKFLVESFYGQKPKYNYFAGCSTGGRQAMKETQKFPLDYDGVIAACPAWWTTHQQLFNLKQTTFQAPEGSPHTIPMEIFAVIGEEAIRQCDPQDGLVDNIISDPLGCNFDYLPLLCTETKNTSCLTGPQLETLHHIYNDWVETNQTFVYAHSLYGSEVMWSEGGSFGNGSAGNVETQLWYPRQMLGMANFTAEDLDFSLVEYADQTNPGDSSADNYDLAQFYRHGAKLIHYHGHSDATVPPGIGLYYRDHLAATMAPQGIDVDDFYRLFLIPGMEHCYNTPSTMNAPWYIAGPTQASSLSASLHSVPGYQDPKHDILLALIDWVENGVAPEYIIGSHFNSSVDISASTIDKQRPICAYPKMAQYVGSGDINGAANFECKTLY
ncbi:tannase and feruloyl esterase [Aspergillus sclerotioniger CBS 115572]|uniref:Carboxylic ester hydrolase n=1 Tax=Aspergillus sclerotioniger CBS 115572 TaxID=1450535 RepID=A0A317W6C9_9EURO|nr:tannase and feruloyl esterase [Aspergillus sclerotioniger CBS 115572]PWY80797.1 tannase and feruloyl esterase [Aspergillus sclerotioniger CBS 115572]